MTGLHATLRRSGGLDALSRRLAMPPADVAAAAARLLPPLLARYRRIYDQAGAGLAGVNAVTALVSPYGGGELALTILASGTLAPDAATGLLSRILDPGETVEALATESVTDTPTAEDLATVLPLLNLLVGGYLTARAEAAGESDIAAEFETLLGG